MSLTWRQLLPVVFAKWTTAERDAVTDPPNYLVIYNTTLQKLEIFDGIDWQDFLTYFGTAASEEIPVWNATEGYWEPKSPAEYLAMLSGEAAAAFDLNGQKLTGLAAGSGAGDSVRYEQAELLANKDAASGYAGLTAGTKLNLAQMQEVIAYADLTDDPAVLKTLFDAHTILMAVSDNTPAALAVAASRIVGRKATGNIGALTGTEATAILDAFTSALKGLAPASGGGTSNFLRADGTWAAPGGGGSSHAPVGALYPGVLSTGVKTPQVPYYGDTFTATKFYCRVSVAPGTTAITVQLKRGVGDGASANLGTVATIAVGSCISTGGVLNQAIASGDFFEINITQTGTTPNQGSDLVWLVAP